jgi:hypothetical protein
MTVFNVFSGNLMENNLGTCSPKITCKEVMIRKESTKEIVCNTPAGKNGISHGKRYVKRRPTEGSPTQPKARLVIVMAICMEER